MLRAEKVSFGYDGAMDVIRDMDFALAPGEVVGLPGPSGQGKSTLARLLAGYLAPRSGRIACDGESLPGRGFSPVQLLFQHPELAMNPRWLLGDIVAEGHRPERTILASLNIEPHWLARYPHELSGGELQRLALARAMGPRTRYLIADEMTAMLDPSTQAMIWQSVLGWASDQGVGILAISHDRHLLARIAHRIDESFAPAPTAQEPEIPIRRAA
jgi:ABC-type dipeptide/oligopeptide/nickel transport system ATPase subunit